MGVLDFPNVSRQSKPKLDSKIVGGLRRTDCERSQTLEPNKFTGPMSGPMWQRVCKELKDSAYPDEFDYTVYDKLARRFGDMRPRGGIVFRSFLKLLESEDCKHCFHRFEMDTYGRGCFHNCAYCYARAYLHQRKMWNEPQPFPIDIVDARKLFYTVFETDRRSKWRELMEKRIPLRLGSMSDSFLWLDKQYKVTLEFLKLLEFYDYPATIVTRSDLVADDEYLAHMSPKNIAIQMSLISINERMTRLIEPGAPSPARRLDAVRKLSEAGFHTAIRINPLFPIHPDGHYSGNCVDSAAKPFQVFSWDMIPTIASYQPKTVIVGMGRLYMHNVRFMNAALGYDVRSHFLPGTKYERAGLHFSQAETDYYYRRVKEQCDEAGVRFSVCYIGNDSSGIAYDRYRPMWVNSNDCCDSLGSVQGIIATTADMSSKPTCKNRCGKS